MEMPSECEAANDEIPGVHLPEPDVSDKIPGVGSTDQYSTDHADVDVGIDFDSHVPGEPILVDTGATDLFGV